MHKISPKASLFENACVKQINLVEEYDNMNFNGWQLMFKDFCLVGLPRQRERVEFWGKERKKKRGGGVGALSCKVPIGSGALHDTSCKIWGWEVFFEDIHTCLIWYVVFVHWRHSEVLCVMPIWQPHLLLFHVWLSTCSKCFFFLGVFSYINYVKLLTWTNYISKNLGTQVFNNSFHNCWLQKFGIKASCCWGGMLWLPDWCIIKWSMLGLSGKWCYSYHNLFLKKIIN